MTNNIDTLYYDLSKFYNIYSSKKDYTLESEFIEFFIKKYFPSAKSILDVGCGQGDHLFHLSKKGYFVSGLDKSEEQIAVGKKKFPLLDLKVVDFLDYKVDRQYDCVTMLWNTILYFSPPEKLIDVFRIINNVLSAGGLFIFEFRSFSNHVFLNDFKPMLERSLEKDGYTMKLFTENNIDLLRGVLVERTRSEVFDSAGKVIFSKDHNPVELNVLSLADIKIFLETSGFEILDILDLNALYTNNLEFTADEKSKGYSIVAKKILRCN